MGNDMKIIKKRQLDLNDYNIIDSKEDLEVGSKLEDKEILKTVKLNEVVIPEITQTSRSLIVNQVELKRREESVKIMNQAFISSKVLARRIIDD